MSSMPEDSGRGGEEINLFEIIPDEEKRKSFRGTVARIRQCFTDRCPQAFYSVNDIIRTLRWYAGQEIEWVIRRCNDKTFSWKAVDEMISRYRKKRRQTLFDWPGKDGQGVEHGV